MNQFIRTILYFVMKRAAATDDAIAKRVRHLEYRTVEEFYDLTTDPDCLRNRVSDADHQPQLTELRVQLREWLEDSNDVVLTAFDQRNDATALDHFMQQYLQRAQRQMQQRQVYEEATGYRF